MDFPKAKPEQNSPTRNMRRQRLLDIEDRYVNKKSNNKHNQNSSPLSSPYASTSASATSTGNKRTIMNEEETNANKGTCTNVLELNIPNNPILRVNTLQMAMD